MPFVSFDERRFNLALGKLSYADYNWFVHAIPDELAHYFAAAKKMCCMADFHRPTRIGDASLYKSDAKLTINATFLPENDIFNYGAQLQTESLLLSVRGDHMLFRGNNGRLGGAGASGRCDYVFMVSKFKPMDLDCLLLLLCFEDVDVDLVCEVQRRGGKVILIQDDGGDPKNPVDTKYFDFRVPAAVFPEVMQAMFSQRAKYAAISS